jgi:hypothetical protein
VVASHTCTAQEIQNDKVQNVEVSDTTGDAKRDTAGNKNINEKNYHRWQKTKKQKHCILKRLL